MSEDRLRRVVAGDIITVELLNGIIDGVNETHKTTLDQGRSGAWSLLATTAAASASVKPFSRRSFLGWRLFGRKSA